VRRRHSWLKEVDCWDLEFFAVVPGVGMRKELARWPLRVFIA
jgi:hypothetical protein